MTTLSDPHPTLAAHIIREVGFQQRLVGVKMTPMAGNRVTSLYSLKEAVDFLGPDTPGDLLHSRHASLGYLDVTRLVTWIREVLGDAKLAALLDEELPRCRNQLTTLAWAGKRMKERLVRCEALVRFDPAD